MTKCKHEYAREVLEYAILDRWRIRCDMCNKKWSDEVCVALLAANSGARVINMEVDDVCS